MIRGGRPRLYRHYGREPRPPTDKDGNDLRWQPAYTTTKNPAFTFLKKGLDDGTIKHYQSPHSVYNLHQELYIINPSKFPDFFRKTVKKVCGINISVEPYDDSAAAADEAATATAAAAADEAATADNADDDEEEEEDNTSSVPSYLKSTPPSSPSRPTSIMNDFASTGSSMHTDNKGTVCHADELISYAANSGNHIQVHLPYKITHNRPNGPTLELHPLSGMTTDNTVLRVSTECDRTALLIQKTGPEADPKKVEKSLTKGTHYIHSKKTGDSELRLDPHCNFVRGSVAATNEIHGRHVSDLKSSSIVMSIKFKRPIDRSVVEVPATNGTMLPGKFDQRPYSDTPKKDAIHKLYFNLKYADLSDVEYNMYSSDSSAE